MRRRWWVPLAGALVWGCWSLDHLTNGVVPADSGSSSDGGGARDGTVDAPITSPCAWGTHLLCDDFESGLRIGAGTNDWDGKNEDMGVRVEVSTAHARSGTHSLHVSVPRNDSLVTMLATVWKQYPLGTWSSVRVQMNVYMTPASWTAADIGNAAFTAAAYGPSEPFIGWTAGFTKSTLQFHIARPTATSSPDAPLPAASKWFAVSAEWSPGGSGQFVASIDGVELDRRTIALDGTTAPTSGGYITVSVGLQRFEKGGNVPTPPLDVYIDDIVVDRQ